MKVAQPLLAVRDAVEHALALAEANGIVVEVKLVPRQPLSMGNYEMVVDVRECLTLVRKREWQKRQLHLLLARLKP